MAQAARITRRSALAGGVAGAAAVVIGGLELVSHGVLPGRHELDELDGACSVPSPVEHFLAPGPSRSGEFYSNARGRTVGYTVAYPPGHRFGDRLPLAVVLHGFGGNHTSGLGELTLTSALAAQSSRRSRPPIALVAADGGTGYWNPHPGDDPLAMVIDELIPLCQRLGLGREESRIGVIGTSMGGFGTLLMAERYPHRFAAAAAISPAIWTTYAEARAANPGAFASARAFAQDDVISHAVQLATVPTRVASGAEDPFHPGVEALAAKVPPSTTVTITGGCHDGLFFASQRPASLAFLAERLQ